MKTHPTFPGGQYLHWMIEKIGEIIEKNVSESSSENHAQKYIQEEGIHMFIFYHLCVLDVLIADEKSECIHESIPGWTNRDSQKGNAKYFHKMYMRK